jgi:hypothetical protein
MMRGEARIHAGPANQLLKRFKLVEECSRAPEFTGV